MSPAGDINDEIRLTYSDPLIENDEKLFTDTCLSKASHPYPHCTPLHSHSLQANRYIDGKSCPSMAAWSDRCPHNGGNCTDTP